MLWAHVIQRLARAVVFVDGWEWSNGCAFEFLIAQRTGKPCTDEHLRPVSATTGKEMVECAIQEIGQAGESTEFLECVLADLQPL